MYMNQDRPTRRGRGFKNHVLLTLLDASKAFDRAFRALLLQKLRDEGISGMLFEVLVAYYAERYQRVNVGQSFSDYVETLHGGPQGSVIMLFAWLVYINDITNLINDCNFGLFVDDFILILG